MEKHRYAKFVHYRHKCIKCKHKHNHIHIEPIAEACKQIIFISVSEAFHWVSYDPSHIGIWPFLPLLGCNIPLFEDYTN